MSVLVVLGIQPAMCKGHVVICGLPRSTIYVFPRYLIHGKIFEKKKFY